MPTYQYACTSTDCATKFELVQSFTDPAASVCPACGGPVRKVFSSVGVVFKGSGFYRTDSRKAESSSSPASSGSSGSGSAASASVKSSSETSSSSGSSSSTTTSAAAASA